MYKLLILTSLFLFTEAQYVTSSYFTDSSCTSMMGTQTVGLNSCVNIGSSSTNYTVCNSSLVFGYIYTSVNCTDGNQVATITKTPNSCDSLGPYYEKFTCSSTPPSPPPPPPAPSPPSTGTYNFKIYFGSPTCSGTPSINKDFTLNSCIDYSLGGFSASYKFSVCNSSRAVGTTYMNNVCSGAPMSTFNSPVGICNNNNGDGEFFNCVSSSPSPQSKISSSNIYHLDKLFFAVIVIFSFILI